MGKTSRQEDKGAAKLDGVTSPSRSRRPTRGLRKLEEEYVWGSGDGKASQGTNPGKLQNKERRSLREVRPPKRLAPSLGSESDSGSEGEVWPAKKRKSDSSGKKVPKVGQGSEAQVCRNPHCKRKLGPDEAYCKSCCCTICHHADEAKDPTLWINCQGEEEDGTACGCSSHLRCALEKGLAGVLVDKKSKELLLDAEYRCLECGCNTGLIGCWKRQLEAAQRARRVEDLTARVELAFHLLEGSPPPLDALHRRVQQALKALEKDNASKAPKELVSRRPVAAQVQRSLRQILEEAGSFLDGAVEDDAHDSTCYVCDEGGLLLMCDGGGCPKAFHLDCAGLQGPPAHEWLCPDCQRKERARARLGTKTAGGGTPEDALHMLEQAALVVGNQGRTRARKAEGGARKPKGGQEKALSKVEAAPKGSEDIQGVSKRVKKESTKGAATADGSSRAKGKRKAPPDGNSTPGVQAPKGMGDPPEQVAPSTAPPTRVSPLDAGVLTCSPPTMGRVTGKAIIRTAREWALEMAQAAEAAKKETTGADAKGPPLTSPPSQALQPASSSAGVPAAAAGSTAAPPEPPSEKRFTWGGAKTAAQLRAEMAAHSLVDVASEGTAKAAGKPAPKRRRPPGAAFSASVAAVSPAARAALAAAKAAQTAARAKAAAALAEQKTKAATLAMEHAAKARARANSRTPPETPAGPPSKGAALLQIQLPEGAAMPPGGLRAPLRILGDGGAGELEQGATSLAAARLPHVIVAAGAPLPEGNTPGAAGGGDREGAPEGGSEAVFARCVKSICWLEKNQFVPREFRKRFLTWFSLQATQAQKNVVALYIDSLGDNAASLAEQLLDTFGEAIMAQPGKLNSGDQLVSS